MKLSKHFTLQEATKSATAAKHGLDNQPTAEHLEAMKFTALRMEAVRQLLGNVPIIVTSWYRSPELNAKIPGSSKTSQHSRGQAVDFVCPRFGTPREIALHLLRNKGVIQYDQLILEPTWIHISFTQGTARGIELTSPHAGSYLPGIR